MAIRVVHQPSAASFGAAYAAGYGRRQQRQQKYALDLWERERILQQQMALADMRYGGGRLAGTRRAGGGALTVGGRWVNPLDSEEVNPFMTEGELGVMQKAQMRRNARRARLGMAPIDYSKIKNKHFPQGVPDLRPQWQSPEEVQAILDQQEEQRKWAREDDVRRATWKHQEDMIRLRQRLSMTPFEQLDQAGQQDAIRVMMEDITADPEEGMVAYSAEQRTAAKKILNSTGLSPVQKFEFLQKILANPGGVPVQSFADQWKANSIDWNFAENRPAEEGDDPKNVGPVPTTTDTSGTKSVNWTAYNDSRAAAYARDNPQAMADAIKRQAQIMTQQAKVRAAGDKLSDLRMKQSQMTKEGEEDLTPIEKQEMQNKIDNAIANLEAEQAALQALTTEQGPRIDIRNDVPGQFPATADTGLSRPGQTPDTAVQLEEESKARQRERVEWYRNFQPGTPSEPGLIHGGTAKDALYRIGQQPPPDPNAVGALNGGYARDAFHRIDPNAPPPTGPQIKLLTAEEFSKQWATLDPGKELRGPDGLMYRKRKK